MPSGVSTTALTISSFTTTAADLYGNTLQATVPTGSVFNGKTIAIDTSAPTTTITAVEYTDSGDGLAGTLVLTGDNFTGTNGLGVTQGNDAKSYLNWDNFVWQVKDGSGVTSSVTFNPETEVTSAIVTNDTTMTITLDAAANTALKGTENFAAQGAADSVAITAGFIKDISGNASTTDAATLAPDYADPLVVRRSRALRQLHLQALTVLVQRLSSLRRQVRLLAKAVQSQQRLVLVGQLLLLPMLQVRV